MKQSCYKEFEKHDEHFKRKIACGEGEPILLPASVVCLITVGGELVTYQTF